MSVYYDSAMLVAILSFIFLEFSSDSAGTVRRNFEFHIDFVAK